MLLSKDLACWGWMNNPFKARRIRPMAVSTEYNYAEGKMTYVITEKGTRFQQITRGFVEQAELGLLMSWFHIFPTPDFDWLTYWAVRRDGFWPLWVVAWHICEAWAWFWRMIARLEFRLRRE